MQHLIESAYLADDQDRLDDAFALADAAVQRQPNSAAAWALRARIHYRRHDHAAASADVDRALACDARSADAIRVRALLLMDEGETRWPVAMAMLDAVLARETRHYGCLLARGWLHQERGDLAAAVRDWEAAVAADPARTVARYNLGSHLGALDRRDEAIAHMQQVARMRPDDGMTAYNVGTAIANHGREDLAIEHFDRGRRLLGAQNAIQLNRADCLMRLKRWQEALDELDSLLEREPEWPWARLRRAQSLAALGRDEESEAEWQRTMALEDMDLDTMRAYARDRAERGRYDDALAVWNEIDAAGMAEASDYFARGGCRLDAEREPELALADYERAIAMADGDDPAAEVNRIVCLNRLGRHAEALAGCERDGLQSRHPQPVLRERLRACIGLKRAREVAELLPRYEQERETVRSAAADCLREGGLMAQALSEYAQLAQRDPSHGYYAWGMGECLLALHRHEEAAHWYGLGETAYRAVGNERSAQLCADARAAARKPRGWLSRMFGSH